MIPYRFPKSGKPKQANLPFSLGSLRLMAWAIDPAAVRLSLRYMTGADLCPEAEAKVSELHEDARHLVIGVFEDMHNQISPGSDPMILLAMLLEKHVGSKMPGGRGQE